MRTRDHSIAQLRNMESGRVSGVDRKHLNLAFQTLHNAEMRPGNGLSRRKVVMNLPAKQKRAWRRFQRRVVAHGFTSITVVKTTTTTTSPEQGARAIVSFVAAVSDEMEERNAHPAQVAVMTPATSGSNAVDEATLAQWEEELEEYMDSLDSDVSLQRADMLMNQLANALRRGAQTRKEELNCEEALGAFGDLSQLDTSGVYRHFGKCESCGNTIHTQLLGMGMTPVFKEHTEIKGRSMLVLTRKVVNLPPLMNFPTCAPRRQSTVPMAH